MGFYFDVFFLLQPIQTQSYWHNALLIMFTASKIKSISNVLQTLRKYQFVSLISRFRQQQQHQHSAPAKVNDMRAFKQFYALKPENHLWLWCIEQYQPKDLNHMHRWMMVFTHHFYLLFLLRVTQQPRALTICTYTRNCFSFFFSSARSVSTIMPNKHRLHLSHVKQFVCFSFFSLSF